VSRATRVGQCRFSLALSALLAGETLLLGLLPPLIFFALRDLVRHRNEGYAAAGPNGIPIRGSLPGRGGSMGPTFENDHYVLVSLRMRSTPLSYVRGQGSTFQISVAYSAMVRSLENFPDPATFRIALRDHSSGSAYNSMSLRSVSRYDLRSAKCMK
jgi:hypothetical protein